MFTHLFFNSPSEKSPTYLFKPTSPVRGSYFQKSKKMTPSHPPGHWARISLAVRTQLMSTGPDLWLVSSEGYSLPTYASLLTLHSPLIKTLLVSSNSSPSSTSTLSLPVPALPLQLLLSLLSEGSVSHHQPFNPLEVFPPNLSYFHLNISFIRCLRLLSYLG